jgi:hypothetical protein
MFLLIVETSSFSFHTVAKTEEEGHQALLKAWKTHCKQTGAKKSYMKELINGGGVNVYPVVIGQVLRDGEPIE